MGNAIVVDFSNVKDQSGLNPTHQPAGDYRGKVVSFNQNPSKAGNPQVTYTVQDVDRPSATYRYNCPLAENALFKLRNILVAAGVAVPKKKIKVDPERIVGREIGMSLDDHEYEGKMSSEIIGVFPASDLPADDDDTEDEPAPKAAAKKTTKKAAPAAAEAEEEEEEEELDELDIDDL